MVDLELRVSVQVDGTDDYEEAMIAAKSVIVEALEDASVQVGYKDLTLALADVEELS